MLFQKGDFFEVSGKKHFKVIYADENIFICCPIHFGNYGRNIPKGLHDRTLCLTSPAVFSNRSSLEGKYWIKKIDAYECAEIEVPELT
ncbi:hypothetical protein [Anaerosolibacter sp.]|uniref:hypothetical protein n=1 Tax=Anaerosolibacter sp. TaxID=1872527 RepID=UPI0039EF86EE